MTAEAQAHSSHADLDVEARAAKARKIIALLRGRVPLHGAKVLEVGTGAGIIADSLRDEVGAEGEVWAVDVVDQRLHPDGVSFVPVTGTRLPFPDDSFDLVLSNHVIEHVGNLSNQDDHLREVARVLRPGGSLYLAMPNRWAPVEPHFKLPFLSWLPEGRRSSYVRAMHRGAGYDCRPLTRTELAELFEAHGLEYTDLSRSALDVMRSVEGPSLPGRLLLRVSALAFPLARPILPSLIFLARRPLDPATAANADSDRRR
jgi:SAM-dependent methyltransferase